MFTGTQRVNSSGAIGWELPHLVAPAVNVDTSGGTLGAVTAASGTSFAAPQISGAVAIAQEANPVLKFWPEVILPALLVGADEGVDENLGGVWPMNLHDSIDDMDGAGLYYGETYYASVPSGTRLRAAAHLQSRPTCGSPANETNCASNPFPMFYLTIFNSSGAAVATSANGSQNYQYTTILNQSGSTQTYTMRIWVAHPSGVSSTTFGVAWLAT